MQVSGRRVARVDGTGGHGSLECQLLGQVRTFGEDSRARGKTRNHR